MKEYIESIEHDFSFIENGFKVEEKRALNDYKAHDREYIKALALLAYKSESISSKNVWRISFGVLIRR